VPGRPLRGGRCRQIRYITGLTQFTERGGLTRFTGRSMPLAKKWLSPLLRLKS
jgi:hypothetical protein